MICKYKARLFDIDSGEVREISLTSNIMKFYQDLMRLVRMFLTSCEKDETIRLRLDITKN